MATLVLTAVGTAIGGPIGGALGAFVGQQLDQNLLFKPVAREGPRIQELAVQTSSYGTQIPRIFGRMRVAGSVIWATDLKETKNTEGGKGRPKTTTYSYSACFAVALSSRPIQGIGRIWADGKIFRGSAGDFKTETGFRFLDGHEDQPLDSLIASAEGQNGCPAFRGLALAIFEDMELADYGNRIPSLTFEIIGDDGTVSLVNIVDDLSKRKINLSSEEQLHGYVAFGENRRSAIAPIAESYSISFSSENGWIFGRSRSGSPASIFELNTKDVARNANGDSGTLPNFTTSPEVNIPRQLELRYYEPEREYQSGLQTCFRPGHGRIVAKVDFPVAIEASQAKQVAQNYIWRTYHERSRALLPIPLVGNMGGTGGHILLDGNSVWKIRGWEFRDGIVSLSISSSGNVAEEISFESESGRSNPDRDLIAGSTRLALFDLPFTPEAPNQASDSAQLFAIGAGDAGWRGADLHTVRPDGSFGDYVGKLPSPGTLGSTEHPLPASSGYLFDRHSSLLVQLSSVDMKLHDADEIQLQTGANVALVGQEIVQFGRAEPLGNGRYKLSRFTRGLGGTESYMGGHSSNEVFVRFEPSSSIFVPSNYFTLFQPARFVALGRSDEQPVQASISAPGLALRPWAPVHLGHVFRESGDLELSWTRRSRSGSSWMDYVDIPLAEEAEVYSVRWENQPKEIRVDTTVSTASYVIAGALLAEYRNLGVESLEITIRQQGQNIVSAPCSASIVL